MVDGISYQCKTSIYIDKIVNKGQDKVYYDSKNPAKCINEYESSSSIVSWLVLLIPILFVGAGLFNFIKGIMRIKKIKYLAKYGTLFKGLNYELQYTGMVINNKQILAPVVNFTLPNGSTIKLVGDARHDGKMYDQDGLVDLLIDLNDPKNYYIDFEIGYKE